MYAHLSSSRSPVSEHCAGLPGSCFTHASQSSKYLRNTSFNHCCGIKPCCESHCLACIYSNECMYVITPWICCHLHPSRDWSLASSCSSLPNLPWHLGNQTVKHATKVTGGSGVRVDCRTWLAHACVHMQSFLTCIPCSIHFDYHLE